MAHVTVRTVVVAESRVLLQGVSGTCEVEQCNMRLLVESDTNDGDT
jgi:hypothetical protein